MATLCLSFGYSFFITSDDIQDEINEFLKQDITEKETFDSTLKKLKSILPEIPEFDPGEDQAGRMAQLNRNELVKGLKLKLN